MKKRIAGSLAFDTSVLLELLFSTSPGLKLKEVLKNEEVYGNFSEIRVAELKLFYAGGLAIRRQLSE
ncbi:MAG: hypothetical protein RMI79_07470 [Nitrososphaerota archaeon]|nr:hypothetical protein [Nitrososphaerota archaeon]